MRIRFMTRHALNTLAWLLLCCGVQDVAATILGRRFPSAGSQVRLALLHGLHNEEVYDGWGLTSTLPSKGRVAVLLRGETFRAKPNLGSCRERVRDRQFNATNSIIRRVVEPLEAHGNVVDIFMQDAPAAERLPADCYKEKSIFDMLGEKMGLAPKKTEEEELRCVDTDSTCRENATRDLFSLYQPRNVTVKKLKAGAQGDGIRKFLNFFNEAVGSAKRVAQLYDLVIVTRHDLTWEAPIDTWPANFSQFNFASRCEREGPCACSERPRECVHDILHVLPGSMYERFDQEVGTKMCFCFKNCKPEIPKVLFVPQSGHGCFSQMANSFGEENVGFATDWVPRFLLREHNNFANIQ